MPTKAKTSGRFEANNGSGKTCMNMVTKKPWTNDNDCEVFAKFKCCNFFHPKAPKGTTGVWTLLNAGSQQILAKGGRGPGDFFGSARLRKQAEDRARKGF